MLNRNRNLECSTAVLRNYFAKNVDIVPELSTRSMNDEIIYDDSCIKTIKYFLAQEEAMQFHAVDGEFRVIDDDNTVIAVVDKSLAASIEQGCGDWRELQKKSVSIHRGKSEQWKMRKIRDNIYLSGVLGYNLDNI